jgi:precorrin-6Y C5,15-methyltransferase (decarboxylating)
MVEPFAADKAVFASHNNGEMAAKILSAPQQEIAVLFSGDVGFYSGAARLRPLLTGCEITMHCGISSFHYFCSRLGISYEDVYPVSLHGRESDLIGAVRRHRRVFALTGNNVSDVCQTLIQMNLHHVTVTVGENLSYPEERIVTGKPSELLEQRFSSLSVLLVENNHAKDSLSIGLPDDAFLRGKVPMTKSEVRCLCLSKLQPERNDICWDIGAGTGSVSVEMALHSRHVYAVERNQEGVALIEENKARFSVSNITVVEGSAPEVLSDLPAPDVVFIGGSGGTLEETVKVVLSKNSAARIVISAVTLETLWEVERLEASLPLTDCELVQLQAARREPLGRYHRFATQNPVWIFSCRGDG